MVRNLMYFNADGMVNVHPKKDTVQINDDYYCEMTEEELDAYLTTNGCTIEVGQILDCEDGYNYGTVLELRS